MEHDKSIAADAEDTAQPLLDHYVYVLDDQRDMAKLLHERRRTQATIAAILFGVGIVNFDPDADLPWQVTILLLVGGLIGASGVWYTMSESSILGDTALRLQTQSRERVMGTTKPWPVVHATLRSLVSVYLWLCILVRFRDRARQRRSGGFLKAIMLEEEDTAGLDTVADMTLGRALAMEATIYWLSDANNRVSTRLESGRNRILLAFVLVAIAAATYHWMEK